MSVKIEAPAVEMQDVSFSYDGRAVLEDVDVYIPRGDFTGIVGPNGGGKTTLLKLMLGLLRPDRGQVRVLGRPPHEVSRRIGYVPQSFSYNRRLPITVGDVVMMGRLAVDRNLGPRTAHLRERAREALEQVSVSELIDRRFGDTSAGQQQRVLIARALATDPEILMLDEPTASLDAAAEGDIYDLLRELNERMTVVLITHDLGFVSGVVQSVLCVNRRVRRHPTSEMGQISGELLEELYGRELRLVRHDRNGVGGCCE